MTTHSFAHLETLSVSIDQKIAHIELSRPAELNSMNHAFWQELPETVHHIDDYSLARVIVISAQGKHFSAGLDLEVLHNLDKHYTGEPARRAEKVRRMVLGLQESFTALEDIRIPILAAVHGGVIGGAIDMICACDCRYATQDSFFTIKETQLGLAADVGTLQRLPKLMSPGLVRELTYTGRNFTPKEALQHGFINGIYTDKEAMLDDVMRIAAQIAANSPVAVTGSKAMLNYARDHTVADSLNYMATWQSGMLQMPDIQTALHAEKTKTPPVYAELHHKKD